MDSDLVTIGGEARLLIQRIAGTFNKDEQQMEKFVVDSVDETEWLCDATPVTGANSTKLTGIHLTADSASTGVVQIPTIGSNIWVAFSDRNEPYMVLCSDIKKFIIYIARTDGFQFFTVTADGIQMGDGSYGGLVIAESGDNGTDNLQDQLTSNNAYINALQQQCLAFATLFDSIAPGTLAKYNFAMDAVTLGDFSKIINKKIIHGT